MSDSMTAAEAVLQQLGSEPVTATTILARLGWSDAKLGHVIEILNDLREAAAVRRQTDKKGVARWTR